MYEQNQIAKTCKECAYWEPFENDPEKGICTNPERFGKNSVHYHGYIKANDYCTKIIKKKERPNE